MTVCGQPREAFVASLPLEDPIVAALEEADLPLRGILDGGFLAGRASTLHQLHADAIGVPEVAPALFRPAGSRTVRRGRKRTPAACRRRNSLSMSWVRMAMWAEPATDGSPG